MRQNLPLISFESEALDCTQESKVARKSMERHQGSWGSRTMQLCETVKWRFIESMISILRE